MTSNMLIDLLFYKRKDLSNNSKSDLRKLGFENFEINKIDIELQLLGLGLK